MNNRITWMLGAVALASSLPAMAQSSYTVYPVSDAFVTVQYDVPKTKGELTTGESIKSVKVDGHALVLSSFGYAPGTSTSDIVDDQCGKLEGDEADACADEIKGSLKSFTVALAAINGDPCDAELVVWNKKTHQVEEGSDIAVVGCGTSIFADSAFGKSSSAVNINYGSLDFEVNEFFSGSLNGFVKTSLKDDGADNDVLQSSQASHLTGVLNFDSEFQDNDYGVVSDGGLKVNFTKPLNEGGGNVCDLAIGECGD